MEGAGRATEWNSFAVRPSASRPSDKWTVLVANRLSELRWAVAGGDHRGLAPYMACKSVSKLL